MIVVQRISEDGLSKQEWQFDYKYHNSSLIFMKNIIQCTKKLLCDFGVLFLEAHNLEEIYD